MTLRALRTYAQRAQLPAAGERCELCSEPLAERHGHVVDLEQRGVLCACRPCAILFEQPAGASRYRTVPDRVLADEALVVTGEDWARLGVPVRLAFVFFHSTLGRWVAQYPSPAGTIEAEVDDDALIALSKRTPLVGIVEPDVEALLAWGRRGQPNVELFLAPIDACYALAGEVRRLWRGFDGGDEVHRALHRFFQGLRARSRSVHP